MNSDDAWKLLKSIEPKRLKTKSGKDFIFEVSDNSISYFPRDGAGNRKSQSRERFDRFFEIYFSEEKRTRDDYRNKDGTGSHGGGYSYFMSIFRLVEAYEGRITPNERAADLADPPPRIRMETYRIVRDTGQARVIKNHHDYLCQLCGMTIELPDGKRYAEAHHIKPLGGVHAGPDISENIIVVCPNHHAMLDLGVIELDTAKIRYNEGHELTSEFIEYHNSKIYGLKR
ncbi:MAG: HNH endonuclease [Pelobacteraceae bacterium]